jgi:hypothetical protein
MVDRPRGRAVGLGLKGGEAQAEQGDVDERRGDQCLAPRSAILGVLGGEALVFPCRGARPGLAPIVGWSLLPLPHPALLSGLFASSA